MFGIGAQDAIEGLATDDTRGGGVENVVKGGVARARCVSHR
jgi:hypothetical protein